MAPANSAVVKRMSLRGGGQLPPLATKAVDDTGVAVVTTWVNSLP